MGIKEEVVVVTKDFEEVTLQIRLPPPATRLICKFKPTDTLKDVYQQVKTEAAISYDFKFRSPPSSLYSYSQMDITLKDARMY